MALQDVKIIITDRNGVQVVEVLQYSDYSFDSQMDLVSDAFSLTLVDPYFWIETGYYIYFYINKKLAFRGTVQRKEISVSKSGVSVTISGKDTSSTLVESFCSSFTDYSNWYPYTIISNLISQTAFKVQKKETVDTVPESDFDSGTDTADFQGDLNEQLQDNDTLSNTNYVFYDENFLDLPVRANFKINIEDKVYDKIQELVTGAGYQVLFEEEGRLYIGDLRRKRNDDTVRYKIINKRNNSTNNIISGSVTDDISGRYAMISVFSQSKTGVNTKKTMVDSTVPSMKTMVVQVQSEPEPLKIAQQLMEDQKQEGYSVRYEVPGHVQGHDFWRVNRFCSVDDEILDIREDLVVYGRTFNFGRDGTTTSLTLGKKRIF